MGGRSLNKLSATEAAKLKTPGRHSDGGGLYLSIDESGRRRWVFMYARGGKRTELGWAVAETSRWPTPGRKRRHSGACWQPAAIPSLSEQRMIGC